MRQEDQFFPDLTLFFKKALYKVKASGLQLDFTIFRQPSNQHTIKTNYIKLWIIDREKLSILISKKRVWEQFFHHVLCMTFQEKCFWCYVLLTDYILFNRDLNRDCLIYMFSLRFSGSKFLINLRRQFRARKVFRTQGFARFTVFPFCPKNA